jgi:hypothetical protein
MESNARKIRNVPAVDRQQVGGDVAPLRGPTISVSC